MLISTAFAQGAETATSGGNLFMSLMPLLVIFIIFYFLLILPQKKMAKERQAMIKGLRRGDRVVTSGGILATIHRLPSDEEAVLEVADGVHIRILRSHLSPLPAKTPGTEPGKGQENTASSDVIDTGTPKE